VVSAIIRGTEEVCRELSDLGIPLYLTGGETADIGDLVRTVVVDSTVVCRMKRTDVIDAANIRPGDVVVGLSSSGRAAYEREYNSGMGSNGLTSARHDIFAGYLAQKYPESFDPGIPPELVYSGKFRLTDLISGLGPDAGKLVLSPTRTYAPVIRQMLENHRSGIHAIIHCSGGGQTKILHFLDDLHVVKDNLFDIPPLFRIIREVSGTSWQEMYRTFNMGHRMELYAEPEIAGKLIAIAERYGVEARIVGRVHPFIGRKLTIHTEAGIFEY
jgi:phosphoribosylformylglycinamidine cyclo-ligase